MTRTMTILGGILLLLAALLGLALVVTAAEINGSDAAGSGMS